MPTLDWIGKNKVITHHRDVPFKVLERKYSFDEKGQTEEDNGSENMIIHGDNLEAFKALLPRFQGRIDCIYIDPPYNTGNENWVYNDNVNDPKIQKWLGEVVGKEGEDLSRHDKWLCMMYPRLRLLQKLLSDDGAIFISIDSNEAANLKLICDEIFGSNCFVSDISWQRTYSPRNDSKGIVNEVEHIFVYSKQPKWSPRKLARTASMDEKYKNPDNDRAPWKSTDACAQGAAPCQGMVYAIQSPFTGKMIYPSKGRHWCFEQERLLGIMQGWCKYELKDLSDAKERAEICGLAPEEVRPEVKAIVLAESFETSRACAQAVYDRGQWPIFYFGNKGKGRISKKTYLENVGGRVVTNLWPHKEVSHTDQAKKDLKAIFNGEIPFDTPKPRRLIERILQISGDKNLLILDSFAGSATTAHAVLSLNAEDGGNRRFVLIELGDYADSITAERVKRVIQGYETNKNKTEGTGGSFSFYDLGEPLLIGGQLNKSVSIEKVREYIWFMETQTPYQKPAQENSYFLGVHNDTKYFFIYEPESATTLDSALISSIGKDQGAMVIYADRCLVAKEELIKKGITFKKIPRDIGLL